MKARLFLYVAAFLAFTIYTFTVVMNHGYTGFAEVALREPWAMQLFIDLVIGLLLFSGFMFADAKKHGIPAIPYFLAMLGLGSIGALAYMVHRTLKQMRAVA